MVVIVINPAYLLHPFYVKEFRRPIYIYVTGFVKIRLNAASTNFYFFVPVGSTGAEDGILQVWLK